MYHVPFSVMCHTQVRLSQVVYTNLSSGCECEKRKPLVKDDPSGVDGSQGLSVEELACSLVDVLLVAVVVVDEQLL